MPIFLTHTHIHTHKGSQSKLCLDKHLEWSWENVFTQVLLPHRNYYLLYPIKEKIDLLTVGIRTWEIRQAPRLVEVGI